MTSSCDEPLIPAGDPCDCELPGYFHSGVPGILARLDEGRLALGAAVERCDLCRRYPSDAAARRRLVELGLAGKLSFLWSLFRRRTD